MISTFPEPLRRLVADIMQEHARAVAKFPGPNVNMTALVEESGELVDALVGYLAGLTSAQGRLARVLLHFRPDDGGDSTWAQVRKEAVQVAVMAIRVALEGDKTLATPGDGDTLQVPSQDNVVPLADGSGVYPAATESLHVLLDVTRDVLTFLDICHRGKYENRLWLHDRAGEIQNSLKLAREGVMRHSPPVPAQVPPLNDQAVRDERQALNDLAITTAEICQFLNDLATGPYGPNLSGRAGRLQRALEAHRLVALRLRDKPADEVATVEHVWVEGPHGKMCRTCREVRPNSLQPGDIMGYHTVRYGDGPARREPLRYQPDDVCPGPVGDQVVTNRSHVAMDRFPERGSTIALRVVHWREGVERYSGKGDLYHLERLDQDTGKWRETNPPLDLQAGKMADLLASATDWLKEHDVKVVWSPKVFANQTERMFDEAPVSEDDRPNIVEWMVEQSLQGILQHTDNTQIAENVLRNVISHLRAAGWTADSIVRGIRDGLPPIPPAVELDSTMQRNVVDILDRAQGFMNAVLSGAELDHDEIMRAVNRIVQVRKDLMDTAPAAPEPAHGAAIRVDGKLFTDVQIRELVARIQDEVRTGADMSVTSTPAPAAPDEPVIFANTVPPLPDGAAIIAIHTNKRMLTATLKPNATHYRVEGKNLVADWTLEELLRNAGLLDPVNEERITTPAGLCRMMKVEGRPDEEAWCVEQFDGKHWQEIASKLSYGFAAGVFMRRMKERFPKDEVFDKIQKEVDLRYIENYRKRHDKVREAFRTVLDTIKKNGGLIDEDGRATISLLIEDTTNALQGF